MDSAVGIDDIYAKKPLSRKHDPGSLAVPASRVAWVRYPRAS